MKLRTLKDLFPSSITTHQAKDTGMSMALICLLIAFMGEKHFFYGAAIILLLLNMIVPNVFKTTAKLWLGLSHLLGSVMSKVILSVIFALLVLPVGLVRRIIGKDSMQLKKWKQNQDSVFKTREHKFTAEDIQRPF